MSRPHLDDWRAETIRFSYFYAGEVAAHLRQGLWRAIAGLEPESSTNRPAEGVIQEQGAFLGGQLIVAVGVNRIDLILAAPPVALDFPHIGAVRQVTEDFRNALANVALDIEAGAVRVAYGVIATCRRGSREEAYGTLNEMLEKVTVSANTRDFFYQINNPRRAQTDDGITLNCLSRWSAVVLKHMRMDGNSPDLPDVDGVRLELDVNTAPETSTLNRNIPGLMTDLVQAAERVLVEGER